MCGIVANFGGANWPHQASASTRTKTAHSICPPHTLLVLQTVGTSAYAHIHTPLMLTHAHTPAVMLCGAVVWLGAAFLATHACALWAPLSPDVVDVATNTFSVIWNGRQGGRAALAGNASLLMLVMIAGNDFLMGRLLRCILPVLCSLGVGSSSSGASTFAPAAEYACSERGVVPGQGCDNRFPFHLNDWGIIDNANDTFGGAQDTLFYKLGAWPTIAGNGTFMNGGQSDKRSVW